MVVRGGAVAVIGVLLTALACARPVAPDRWGWSDAVDDDHTAVVLLDNDCSGTLVGPRAVLTAAHCVVKNDEHPRVVVGEGDMRSRYDVSRCHLHPRAYGRAARCLDDPMREVDDSHDLAVLELGRSVPRSVARPLPVLPGPEPSLRDERLFLVGFHRRPLVVGAVRRYGGWNTVVEQRGGKLTTLPLDDDPQRFSTRPGASGGPALWRHGGRAWVVGVLSGGRAQLSPDSVYASTTHPDNARFLRRVHAR